MADAPSPADLAHALEQLAALAGAGEAAQIELLSSLERLKGAATAAQARVTDSLARARTAREAARGVPAAKRCQGLAAEVALARRCSPHRGARDLGLATALVREMPRTLDLLARGEIGEWRATVVVRETAVLSAEHREQVDAELGDQLPRLGDREAAARARAIGYRPDPGSAIRRTRGALPRPGDGRHPGRAPHRPDPRRRGAARDDRCRAAERRPHPGRGRRPRPDPRRLARELVRDAPRAWLRQLYTRPGTGDLVAMDSRRRTFVGELRDFLVIRDQVCRTPWCDAPIRHADHVVAATVGGRTAARNGQGLCEACNHAKQAPGWQAIPLPGDRHRVLITTPTGHSHVSTAPDPPGSSSPETDDAARSGPTCQAPKDELSLLLASH